MKNKAIEMIVRNNDLFFGFELDYYSVEFYKSNDCTGVAHVNGLIAVDGMLYESGG